ncbi:MAG TPA: hypothetical protein PKW17_13890 [Smithellaceae bacterium]|nr:hypothetical protein [Smithellaceae bacterium]
MDAIKEVTERALTVPEKAKAIIIRSNDDFVRAGEILTVIKSLRKEIDATFDPIIKKAFEAHKEAVAQKKKVDAPLVEAEGIVKPRMAAWNAEQERIRREEEERLREIARKEEEERRLKEAIAAEKSGNKEEAEAILETPIEPPPVVIPKTTPKVAGVSFTKQWKFRITDPNKIPREYLTPDEVKIGGVVRALKDKANIPGVEVYTVDGVSGRAAA